MRVARWLVICCGLATYWSAAACLILGARADPDVFAWLPAVTFTAPVGLVPVFVEPGREWGHAWLTLWTVAGAVTNGALFAWFVYRDSRHRRVPVPVERAGEAADYEDGNAAEPNVAPDRRPL
jgi:hypothetical protein